MEVVKTITGPSDGEVFTASTFLDYMRKSASHWWADESVEDDCPWVFRGHNSADWKLIPTAGRLEGALDSNFKKVLATLETQISKDIGNWNELDTILQEQTLRYMAYGHCLIRFMKLSRDLSFRVDEPFNLLQPFKKIKGQIAGGDEHEDTPLILRGNLECNRDFLMESFSFPYCKIDSVALAQHHGIPTFLLDWTESPIVACHFAASGAEGDLAVWALNIAEIKSNNFYNIFRYIPGVDRRANQGSASVKVYKPAQSDNDYLASQSGVFTTIFNPEALWCGGRKYPALEDVLVRFGDAVESLRADKKMNSRILEMCNEFEENSVILLKKVILPAEQVPELQLLLYREGVSKAHMMPTLDNVADTAMKYMAAKSEF